MPAYNLRSIAPSRRDSQVMPVVPRAEREAEARNALDTADELLARGLLEQAGDRFQAAARAFDELGDSAMGARALLGLGRVLLGLEDPVCREVLEDAGTWLEDLGDEAAVRQVDGLLRIAERSIDDSPRSFHAIRTASEPPPAAAHRK
jgi:hypothetical protein